jgi:hypothetical protein
MLVKINKQSVLEFKLEWITGKSIKKYTCDYNENDIALMCGKRMLAYAHYNETKDSYEVTTYTNQEKSIGIFKKLKKVQQSAIEKIVYKQLRTLLKGFDAQGKKSLKTYATKA